MEKAKRQPKNLRIWSTFTQLQIRLKDIAADAFSWQEDKDALINQKTLQLMLFHTCARSIPLRSCCARCSSGGRRKRRKSERGAGGRSNNCNNVTK